VSEKVKIFTVSADFGCRSKIICRDKKDVLEHLDGLLSSVDLNDVDLDDTLIITVKEMSTKELENAPEFEGC